MQARSVCARRMHQLTKSFGKVSDECRARGPRSVVKDGRRLFAGRRIQAVHPVLRAWGVATDSASCSMTKKAGDRPVRPIGKSLDLGFLIIPLTG